MTRCECAECELQRASHAAVEYATDKPDPTGPCLLTTWCVLGSDHVGPCEEVPRTAHPRQAWDTRTPDPRGWKGTRR